MFTLCTTNKTKDPEIIIFSTKPFKLEGVGLKKIEDLSFDRENISFFDPKYNVYPIVHYVDFMFRVYNIRKRTTSHILDELGINTIDKIVLEYHRILNKTSHLSRSERDHVVLQYNRLKAKDEEVPTIDAPDAPVESDESGS